jgi:hypothetical protein
LIRPVSVETAKKGFFSYSTNAIDEANVTRIFGNVTLAINNPNLYAISLAGMEVNGTIGKNVTNQLHFHQEVQALEIAANGRSSHIVPFDLSVPPEIDTAALISEITRECITNINKMKILMSGTTRIKVLGSTINFSFGPQFFDSRCI